MQFLNYALASMIAYSGLIAGMILIFMGPEEKKPGIKYFAFMQKILFLLIVFFLFFYYSAGYYSIYIIFALTLGIAILLFFYWEKTVKFEKQKQYVIYGLLGAVFYLSSADINFFKLEAALIFIYGLPTGSLLTNSNKKLGSVWRIASYSYFVFIALLLQFLFPKT